jgi:hypothetical protein
VLFLVSELFGNDMLIGLGNFEEVKIISQWRNLRKFTLNVCKVPFQTDYDLYCIFINEVLHSVFS